MKNFFKKIWPTKRKWMQLYFALLFNANIKGFINIAGLDNGRIYQGPTKNVCIPGLNCYSCPGAVGACPLGSLQNAIAAKNHGTIYYVCGTLLLYSILFGRMICGWMCPFGFIQELLHKIKTPKIRKSRFTRVLSYFKYVVLVFFVLIIPLMYVLREVPIPMPGFCKYICPAGTLLGGIGLLSNPVNAGELARLGPLFTWKFLLMVSVLVGCVFVFRLFCRFICPLGALYALFNRVSIFGIKLNRDKCVDCNKCIAHCEMDIHHVGDTECINCGECIAVCPTNAIQWKGPKILLPKNEVAPAAQTADAPQPKKNKRLFVRIVSTVALLAILIGTGIYHWKVSAVPPAKPVGDQSTDLNIERGKDVGTLCYSAALKVMGHDGPTGETIDPSATGRITVLNFWGTWCPPCVAELPDFDRIARDYGDQVTVIAVHGTLGHTGPAYIAKNFPDSPIVFAYDYGANEDGYFSLLSGSDAYPCTFILDERGVIMGIYKDQLHYSDLEAALKPLVEKE